MHSRGRRPPAPARPVRTVRVLPTVGAVRLPDPRRPDAAEIELAEARVRALGRVRAADPGPAQPLQGGWVPTDDEPDVAVPVTAGPVTVARATPPPRWAGMSADVLDRLPLALRLVTTTLTVRAVAALAAVSVAAIGVTGWLVLRNGPHEAVVGGPPVARTVPAATATPTPVKFVVVDVAGKVRRPGVVRLPLGSRVADALRAAGGVRAGVDIGLLNLARPLADGEQVVVGLGPVGVEPGAPGAGSGVAGSAAGAVVDLNAATLADLDVLPGVGPVLAQRILDWRAAHGPFTSVDQLREVSGIGDRKFEDLRSRVRV